MDTRILERLFRDRPYTFRCIESPLFGNSTYQVMYRGNNIAKVTNDAKGIESIVDLMNGAYLIGASDVMIQLDREISTELNDKKRDELIVSGGG